jgi:hypothetical protein
VTGETRPHVCGRPGNLESRLVIDAADADGRLIGTFDTTDPVAIDLAKMAEPGRPVRYLKIRSGDRALS